MDSRFLSKLEKKKRRGKIRDVLMDAVVTYNKQARDTERLLPLLLCSSPLIPGLAVVTE